MNSNFSITSLLESKILNYIKQTKKAVLTYDELKLLTQPYDPYDYILCSTILYEKEPAKFYLLPSLLNEIYDEGRNSSGSEVENEKRAVREDKAIKNNSSKVRRKKFRDFYEARKWKANRYNNRNLK